MEKKEKHQAAAHIPALPRPVRILLIHSAVLLALIAVLFMAGAYLYAPQAAARDYLEARLSGDWNAVYDRCVFPDSPFLSRKQFVNAMAYAEGDDGGETPVIRNFSMRRQKEEETGEERVYLLRYSLQGVSEAREERVTLAPGRRIERLFQDWYVTPADTYVEQVTVVAPKEAELVLDGEKIPDSCRGELTDRGQTYEIPYLFLGGHTVELVEDGKSAYRDVFSVTDARPLEFLPELRLNDENGREIAGQLEERLDHILASAAAGESFTQVEEDFSEDPDVQKRAKEKYEELCRKFSGKAREGIVNLAVTRLVATISSVERQMQAELTVTYTAEEVYPFLVFFHRTRSYAGTEDLFTKLSYEYDRWVVDDGILELVLEEQ